jgi:hypothetical protein
MCSHAIGLFVELATNTEEGGNHDVAAELYISFTMSTY